MSKRTDARATFLCLPDSYLTRTYTDRAAAERTCGRINTARRAGGPALAVIVEGPEDGEWSVMPLQDAIDSDFAYSWVAGRGL